MNAKVMISKLLFYFIMFPLFLIMLICLLSMIQEFISIIKIGFWSSVTNGVILGIVGVPLSITFFLPITNRVYKLYPWFHGLVKFTFFNMALVSLCAVVLNIGYKTTDNLRHILFISLTVIAIILFRLVVSYYMSKRPIIELKDLAQIYISKEPNSHFVFFGLVILIFSSVLFSVSMNEELVSESVHTTEAVKNRVSSELAIGTRILEEDEKEEPIDYTIEHTDKTATKVYVWDYASIDGDYVQVLVDGKPYTSEFVINHKPKEFEVPATCEVEVLGVRDGGGGITYGIHYEVNGYTYFNTAPEGEGNTYTLIFNEEK